MQERGTIVCLFPSEEETLRCVINFGLYFAIIVINVLSIGLLFFGAFRLSEE